MNANILEQLHKILLHQEEINLLLADPKVLSDSKRLRSLTKELSEITPVVDMFNSYQNNVAEYEELKTLSTDGDAEMRDMVALETSSLKIKIEEMQLSLQKFLLPKDSNDSRNVFLEIRAGTGGDEASIFAGDLFKMYSHYAENQGWKIEIINLSEGEHGGYKEIITRVVGNGVYARLKFESGAHRVQRVPTTESQGRIHTSACTVAVMPEADDLDEIDINPADLRIDTYRASGAGGQHVNKTDSAIRITHLPTGVVVECQEERSQHKNRARALSILKSRLRESQEEERRSNEASTRKLLVGTGDRSDRIRTYNFPQGRVTDHRINLTLYRLDEVLEGKVDLILDVLLAEHQAEKLAELNLLQ